METLGSGCTSTRHQAPTHRRQHSTGWTAARPRSAGGLLVNQHSTGWTAARPRSAGGLAGRQHVHVPPVVFW